MVGSTLITVSSSLINKPFFGRFSSDRCRFQCFSIRAHLLRTSPQIPLVHRANDETNARVASPLAPPIPTERETTPARSAAPLARAKTPIKPEVAAVRAPSVSRSIAGGRSIPVTADLFPQPVGLREGSVRSLLVREHCSFEKPRLLKVSASCSASTCYFSVATVFGRMWQNDSRCTPTIARHMHAVHVMRW